MSFIDSRLTKFIFFSSLLLAFFACTKITQTDIGSGLIPPVDGVNTKDTVIDVVTKNQSFDTVAVGFSDNHVLGYTNDPVFGVTNAGVNFQVALPNSSLTFETGKDSLLFDSVVLSFSYKSAWGDTLSQSPLALHVYEMDPENKFTVDSVYNNTVNFEKGTELTAFNTAKIIDISALNNPDTLKYYNEDATNQVRIQLSQAFGQKLLTTFNAGNAYQNDSTFHNYLRGFIVEAEQRGNALLAVNLSDTSTRLSLYYHYKSKTDGSLDSGVRRFPTSTLTCASSNTITRNYTGTSIPNYFPPNSNTQDDLLFIQTSPGTYAKIKIPGLNSLPNMVVHRAEILMSQVPGDPESDKIFTTPNLFLAALDSGRRIAVPNDLIFSSGAFTNLSSFGVLPIKKTNNTSAYSFDISRYVQGVVTRHDSTFDFILWAPYNYNIYPVYPVAIFPYTYPISTPALNSVAIGRVQLGGGNNSQYKMRLHIVYSPVK